MHSVGGWEVGAACRYVNWLKQAEFRTHWPAPQTALPYSLLSMEVQKTGQNLGQNFPKRASRGLRRPYGACSTRFLDHVRLKRGVCDGDHLAVPLSGWGWCLASTIFSQKPHLFLQGMQ